MTFTKRTVSSRLYNSIILKTLLNVTKEINCCLCYHFQVVNHINNLVAIAMATEGIDLEIHCIQKCIYEEKLIFV